MNDDWDPNDLVSTRIANAWRQIAAENGITVEELIDILFARAAKWKQQQGVKAQKLALAKLEWTKHFPSNQSIRNSVIYGKRPEKA